jgi:hypothetical protein
MANTTDYLKKQYAAQQQAALAELKSAYDTNISKLDEEAAAIPQQYETARNEMAAQNAIARKNFNEQAAATGLNTGTSGQAELARSSVYQRNLAGANVAEQNAQQALDRDRLSLQAQYENAIAATKAENDAALNNALYQEMLRQQSYGGGSGGDKKTPVDDWTWLNEGVKNSDTPMEARTKSGLLWQLEILAETKGGAATLDKLKAYAPYMTAEEYKDFYNRVQKMFAKE